MRLLRYYLNTWILFFFICHPVFSQQTTVEEINYYLNGEIITDKKVVENLRWKTEQKVDEPISRYKIRKSIENIYSLGNYSYIEVESERLQPEYRVRLNFWLKSKIIIKNIKIKGNIHISSSVILSAIKSKSGEEYIKSVVKNDLKRIEEVYRKHGYFNSVAKLLPPETDGYQEISIKFFVLEESKASLRTVKFVGNSSIPSNILLKNMKINKETGYNYQVLERDIENLKRLYRDYGYLTVEIKKPKITYVSKENAIDITVLINEGSELIVRYIGEDIDREKFEKNIALYRINNYSKFTLEKSALEIENFYREKGYYNAKVNYRVRKELPDRIIIRFEIDKKNLLTIDSISFEGNSAFSEHELKEKMETEERSLLALPGLRWLFPRGIFDKYQFENDLRAIRVLYRQHGYQEVRVHYEKPIEVREDKMYIKIQIHEGIQTLISQVRLRGNKVLKSENIIPKLSAKVRKPYNQELLSKDVALLRSLYNERGYIYAKIKPLFQSGELTYYINEGKQVKIGKLYILGNERTLDSVVLREFRNFGIDTGEILNLNRINQCQQRLYSLGLFQTVIFELPERSEGKEVLDINVRITERNPGTVNVSGGYSPSEGIRGTFEIAYNNLSGRAMRIGSKLRIGTRGNLYESRFIEPYLFNTRTRFMLRAFQDNLEEQNNIRTIGGTVNLAKSIGLYNNVSLEYKYQELKTDIQDLKTTVSSISVGVNRDTRDYFINPGNGGLSDIVFEYAGGLLSGETSFAKLKMTNKYYMNVKEGTVLALALRTGYEAGLRSYRKKEIISFERFSAGGSTTVRGYSEKTLGPVDNFGNHRGDVMFIFNAELRFPVLKIPIYKWFVDIGGVTFFDSGNVWDKLKLSQIKDSPPKSSVGLGLRIDTSLGPVRVDYGYPFSREDDSGLPGEIYFALGHAF